MKRFYLFLLGMLMISCYAEMPGEKSISLNSVGFLPGAPKIATIVGGADTFVLKNAADETVIYEGKTGLSTYQADVDEQAQMADFSSFKQEGTCFLELPGGERSSVFSISSSVYKPAYYTCMRALYLWRCGTAVRSEYNGSVFAHDACHLDDGYDDYQETAEVKHNGTGGWHDAGDYGKYTVNAGITLGILFMAWDQFQNKIEGVTLDLPETATGYPDFLEELKWETDWLLSMQYPDNSGRISHKLTRLNFSPFIRPEDDHEKRFFSEWSSAATADFVAVMAQAARYFEPYDAKYAKKCLDAAWQSYRFLQKNPGNKSFKQGHFKTGAYQTTDEDDRLWAAAELWETTGAPELLADFERRAEKLKYVIDEDWDWGDVSNLGMFTYVLSGRNGKNEDIVNAIAGQIKDVAGAIVRKASEDVYARPLGKRYYWGCNGTVARQVLNLRVANRLSPDSAYLNTALDAIAHLFGRNYYDRSFVTGIGNNPPVNPHDRRSASDEVVDPWPGYLVGGGQSATGWQDVQSDFTTNEIALNWQAALIYALAGFLPSY
jgi:endoglucanase